MLDHDQPILLVVDDETNLYWFVWNFVYTGFTEFAGYLVGGMKAWNNAGYASLRLPQVTVHEVRERLQQVQLLDVRAPAEWDSGYRAGIAASLLQRRGYSDVRNVPGSWQAWKNAGYEIEK